MTQILLFAVFPYVALALAVGVGLYRFFSDRFSFSSFSSQFLENDQLFWGSVPWHYSILVILIAHILAALFPSAWASLIGEPFRLYALEVTGMALALVTIVGTALLIMRRMTNPRIKVVTSPMDWFLLLLLLFQVASGGYVALTYRWGASWYLHTAVPWLWSLATFSPQVKYIASLPLIAKLHMVSAFLLVALFPFTRLVHIFTIPLTYIWRPYQLVYWNRKPKEV